MPEFHDTGYGRRFFEAQLPALIEAINRAAKAQEEANEIERGKIEHAKAKDAEKRLTTQAVEEQRKKARAANAPPNVEGRAQRINLPGALACNSCSNGWVSDGWSLDDSCESCDGTGIFVKGLRKVR